MTLYSVFERADEPAPAVVPEQFSWLAALLPAVFAIVHGLWVLLVGYVLIVVALALCSVWLGASAAFWLYVLFVALIGFEAPALRRARLAARGWTWRADLIAAGDDIAQLEWLRARGTA